MGLFIHCLTAVHPSNFYPFSGKPHQETSLSLDSSPIHYKGSHLISLYDHALCLQIDQVYKVCAVLGCPTPDSWPEGLDRAGQLGWSFPQFAPTPLAQLVPNASVEAISLMTALCQWDPARRPTATQALAHPFFQVTALALKLHSCHSVVDGLSTGMRCLELNHSKCSAPWHAGQFAH